MTSRGKPHEPWPDDGDDAILLGEVVQPRPPITSAPPSVADDTTDDEIQYTSLAPPEGLSPVQRQQLCLEPVPLSADQVGQPLTQFSLRELMILTTFLSIGLAILSYVPARQAAGVLGLLALVGQGLLMRYPPENRHVNIAAWSLLAMYIIAAATAFVQHL